MQKCVKNEKRYRLINYICLLAVYKKLIGTGRVLGTSILRYGSDINRAVQSPPPGTATEDGLKLEISNIVLRIDCMILL